MLAAILSLIGEHPIDGMPCQLVSRKQSWSFLVELLPTALPYFPSLVQAVPAIWLAHRTPPSSLADHAVGSPDQEARSRARVRIPLSVIEYPQSGVGISLAVQGRPYIDRRRHSIHH
ncbi:hypothetical protein CGRA01v4_05065 [Colletotrichum graminicola]|nr:hypothetical protein CGRA01v4_05065 [Colletotrichum graminicola]